MLDDDFEKWHGEIIDILYKYALCNPKDKVAISIEIYINVSNISNYEKRLSSIRDAIAMAFRYYARIGLGYLFQRIIIRAEYYTNETLNNVVKHVKRMNEIYDDAKNYNAIIDDIHIRKSEKSNDNGM